MHISRRTLLGGALTGAAIAGMRGAMAAAAASSTVLRAIPATGERIPVVGIGTNAFDVESAAELAPLREVLREMPALGGRVIDTARGYGRSEQVLGQLIAELGNRERFFIATKAISAPQANAVLTRQLIDESFMSLRVKVIDLMQVHSLVRFDDLLPLAQEKGIAVLNNVPFGGKGSSLFLLVAGKPLPAWAAEIGATTWARFMLKYNLSHPAITAVIPGTTTVEHLRDSQAAGRGPLPDAAMRKRMEQYWDNL